MSEDILDGKKGITRRRFFLYAWAASAIVMLGEGLAVAAQFLKPRLEEGAFGTKYEAGEVNEFPVGSVTSFEKGQFHLVHLESGFLALFRSCPHLGCIIHWDTGQEEFQCPCHAGVFNQVGEVLAGPVPRPMDIFPIEIVDGQILVDTGAVVQRDSFDASQLAQA